MDWWWLRRVVNAANGSTLLGLVIAGGSSTSVRRGPRGLLLASGYRWAFPPAAAFTVGDVVLTRHSAPWLEQRPRLLAHEERHSWQYVACLGLPLVPLYVLAAGYSYLRSGDPGVQNPFEWLAGLEDGGYPTVSRPVR